MLFWPRGIAFFSSICMCAFVGERGCGGGGWREREISIRLLYPLSQNVEGFGFEKKNQKNMLIHNTNIQ